MPIYMDVHIVPGIKARDVAEAHRKDILLQEEHSCKCMTYWIDEERENVFCLIEAPYKEAVAEMHHRAHGLIPNKIIEVNSELVQSFLGRIYDPSDAVTTGEGLKVFSDPSFRILLVTTTIDPVLLRHRLGSEKAEELLNSYHTLVRQKLSTFEGREVEHGGSGFIASFTSAAKAVACALGIQQDMPVGDTKSLALKIGLNAGEPIAKTDNLFGDTIQLARYCCAMAGSGQVALTAAVKELVSKEQWRGQANNTFTLSPADETLLTLLFDKLEANWQDPDFTVTDYCQAMAMSKSQLYRKTIELSGLSPNILLKEYRLEKAMELMRKQRYSIAQITFDTGFTSPSYFTKCFKRKYGLLPMAYLDMVSGEK